MRRFQVGLMVVLVALAISFSTAAVESSNVALSMKWVVAILLLTCIAAIDISKLFKRR